MARVTCAGHVNWDVTLRVDGLPEPDGEARITSQVSAGGGSAANVAVALVGLDDDAVLVGSVGDDEHGFLARRELETAGVDLEFVRVVPDVPTTVKYLLVDPDGEVMVLGNEGANESVMPEDVDSAWFADSDHLHLTSQRPETATRMADVAHAAGCTVSFDPGRRLADRDFDDTLASADIVFVTRREARAVLDEYRTSSFSDRVFVVKHGERGAVVHTPEGAYDHPGFSVDPVDTTGAGDAFAAGFLRWWLEDRDPERALEYANACGALASLDSGARTAPDTATVERFLDEQY